MSKTREEELISENTDKKSERYEQYIEQYVDGEISEQEYEEKVVHLMEDGDEFVEHDHTPSTVEEIEKTLQYYSLPLIVLGIVGASFLALPVGMAFTLLPITGLLASCVWVLGKLRGWW